MSTKLPSRKSPARTAGPLQQPGEVEPEKADVHRHVGADTDSLIERGNAGDKFALRLLYGQASAWARGGTSPIPEPLGTWIADRLQEVANAIDARKQSDIGRHAGKKRGGAREIGPALAVALKVQRAGVKGRAPNPKTPIASLSLARDVLHFMTADNLLPAPAIRRALEYCAAKNLPTAGEKAYEAAWQRHGKRLMRAAGIPLAMPSVRK